jgi:hypothetical protein
MVSTTPALLAITPTGVSGTGVSVSVGGTITATAATVASVNGCFTDFDHYRIIIDNFASSTQNILKLVLRNAGTDDNSQNPYYLANRLGSTDWIRDNSWSLSLISNDSHRVTLDLLSPGLARQTTGLADSVDFSTQGSSTVSYSRAVFQHAQPIAFDGFSLRSSAGTFSATIRIDGYANN